ncbi:MAG: hypothetical protein ACK452_08195, partial [Bacteroidota bacterium]
MVLKGDYLGAIKFYNSIYNGADTLNTGVWDYLFQNLYCSNKNYDFALLNELRLLNELFIKKNDSARFFLNQLLEIKIEFEKFNCDSFLRIQKLRFQLPGKNEMVTDKYYLFDIYGLIYQKKRNFSSAFEYFTKSNHLADSVNDLNLKLHSLERLKNITLANSDAKNQIFYANELDYIRDSVNRLELKEISIAFNFLNEWNKIRTSNLVANLTKIKNLQSKNSENIKYFICVVLLLLVFFIILTAFVFKSKNKRLKKVLSEQENELLNIT